MPYCVNTILAEYAQKGQQCPSSLPLYYDDKINKIKGCTSDRYNKSLSGPYNKKNVCILYDTMDKNLTKIDSCYNKKDLDDFPCFGNKCTKSLVQFGENTPIIVSVQFADTMGMVHTAYSKKSAEIFLDSTNPTWREHGMELDKAIFVAEVAKAYYIDKTISKEDIQL